VDTAKTTINWRKADWNITRRDMAGMNWSNEFHGKTAQKMWNFFSSKIGKTVSENVPERRQQNGGRPAWLNREIKAAINRKRRLWKKAKGASGVEEYREADKKVKNMIRTAKRNFEKRLANEKGSSNRPFYAYVKKKTKKQVYDWSIERQREQDHHRRQGDGQTFEQVFQLCYYKRG
jgi:hypothetical protein